jgi:hypothetical protein
MFTDVELFKDKLKELVILSYDKLEITSKTVEKEYLMLQRFNTFCNNNNINYQRNPTNGDCVDGTINGYKFQAKYISLSKKNTYQIPSSKKAGVLNSRVINQCYEINDFHYIIVELGGTKDDETKYHNNFCIIPESELIKQNILKSENSKGKAGFYVCKPDYEKPHWSKPFWNVIPSELTNKFKYNQS